MIFFLAPLRLSLTLHAVPGNLFHFQEHQLSSITRTYNKKIFLISPIPILSTTYSNSTTQESAAFVYVTHQKKNSFPQFPKLTALPFTQLPKEKLQSALIFLSHTPCSIIS